MSEYTLPRIFTVQEIAEYLKVDNDAILQEMEGGNLRGFKVGKEWRCSDEDLVSYMKAKRPHADSRQVSTPAVSNHSKGWNIVEIEPFEFKWPKIGGGGQPEKYDKAFEATTITGGQEYTFKVAFTNRKSAGLLRRRVTIWLGSRAIVEFAGSNNYENDGLLAGIIRLKNNKQLTSQKIPEEYKAFRVEKYNSIVQGPRASTAMAVIAHKDDLESMLEHAVIRATWKDII